MMACEFSFFKKTKFFLNYPKVFFKGDDIVNKFNISLQGIVKDILSGWKEIYEPILKSV